eukprot:6197087-Pleurochrysis_carterae.AAC.1
MPLAMMKRRLTCGMGSQVDGLVAGGVRAKMRPASGRGKMHTHAHTPRERMHGRARARKRTEIHALTRQLASERQQERGTKTGRQCDKVRARAEEISTV